MLRNAPCHRCPARTVGCHATCEKYQAYVEDRARWARAQQLAGEAIGASIDGVYRTKRSLQNTGMRKKPRNR